jgi:hypothetical protein
MNLHDDKAGHTLLIPKCQTDYFLDNHIYYFIENTVNEYDFSEFVSNINMNCWNKSVFEKNDSYRCDNSYNFFKIRNLSTKIENIIYILLILLL